MELCIKLVEDIVKYIPHPCNDLMRAEVEELLWDCWLKDYHKLSHGEYLTRVEREKMRDILFSFLRIKLEEHEGAFKK